jgi:hypothetical protein
VNDFQLNLPSGQAGPYTIDEVRAFLHAGDINMGTTFWRPGMKTWTPLNAIRDTLLHAPPTVPTMRRDVAMAQQRAAQATRQRSQGETQYWIQRTPGAEGDGPFLLDQLREQWKSGALRVDMQYYTEDQGDWLSVKHLVQDLKPEPVERAAPHAPARYAAPPAPVASNVQRSLYVCFGLLLGMLGVHNFYAGYTGRGVCQMLLTFTVVGGVVTFFWVICDLLIVTEDSKGRQMQ